MTTAIAFAIVASVLIIGCTVGYVVAVNAETTRNERQRAHEEFRMRLEPAHTETMAKIKATEVAEVAKFTGLSPEKRLELRNVQSGNDVG